MISTIAGILLFTIPFGAFAGLSLMGEDDERPIVSAVIGAAVMTAFVAWIVLIGALIYPGTK